MLAQHRRNWRLAAERYAEGRIAFPHASVFYSREALCRREIGAWDIAEKLLSEAQRVFPEDWTVYAERAVLASKRQDWPEAVNRWGAVRDRFPDVPGSYVQGAVALFAVGRRIEGEQLLDEAVTRFPNDRSVLLEYAKSADVKMNWHEANRRWALFRDRFPLDATGYIHGAQVLNGAGEVKPAQELLNTAIERFPRDTGIAIARLNGLGNGMDATFLVEYWNSAAPNFRNEPIVYNAAARAFARQGRISEADEVLADILGRSSDFPILWQTWAENASAGGDLRLALERLRRGAEACPGDTELQVRLAETALLLRDFHTLNTALDRAIVLAPNSERVVRLRLTVALQQEIESKIHAAWNGVSDHPSIGLVDKLNFAADIIRRLPQGLVWNAAMLFLLCEPDPGSRDWLPRLDRVDSAGRKKIKPEARAFLAEVDTSGCNPICLEVLHSFVGDTLSVERALYHFQFTLGAGRLTLIAALFRMELYENSSERLSDLKKTFRSYSNSILNEIHFRDISEYRQVYNLLVFASVHDRGYHAELIAEIDRRIEPYLIAESAVPANYKEVLGDIVARNRLARLPLPDCQSVSSSGLVFSRVQRALRVAICVSGQLRGYQAAFPSWAQLGLEKHNSTLFIHTWKRVGHQWPRALAFVHGDPNLRILASDAGPGIIRTRYKRLDALLTATLGHGDEVTEADMRAFYRTDYVVVEDESLPQFKSKPNQWKMHYKIEQAYRMAQAFSQGFDLIFRIRPDLEVQVSQPIDYEALYELSTVQRCLIAEFRNMFHEKYWIGDKFVFGASEPMAAFSTAFSRLQALERHRAAIDIPPDFEGHLSLATACALRGVTAITMPEIHAQNMLNPPVISPALFYEALARDLDESDRLRDEFDERFLELSKLAAAQT